MTFTPLGDSAVTVTLASSIDEPSHRRVRAACRRIRAAELPGIVDLVPAFTSIVVHYDPVQIAARSLTGPAPSPYDRLTAQLAELLANLADEPQPEARTVEIPVCYGGDLGPDLDDVARQHSLSSDEVVAAHVAGNYLVYMIGFMPGFAYLGGLDPAIATPRRAAPRMAVPAGTVGIGGSQTGVYPLVSPGGWNLIGRTPLKIFDSARAEPALLTAGDRVRFRPISLDEFRSWQP